MIRYFVSTLILLIASPLTRAEPPKPKLPDTFDSSAVRAYIAEQTKSKNFVGLSIAVVRDGEMVLNQGFGKTAINGQDVTAETPFAIGSVTKQFACACILILADDGKLSVNDPVAKYFPNLTRAGDITLHDLMSHVSGYPDYYPLDFVDRRMRKSIAADDLIREYAGGKLDFEPGTRWSYSNTGYTILGRVVEKVSGEPFGRFLENRILKPCGMKRTIFEPDPEKLPVARGHTSVLLGPAEAAPFEAPNWLNAAGGIFAPAADIARWDIALMNGRMLKPDTLRLMTTARTLKNGKVTDYGCGLSISRQSGETIWSHGGAVGGYLAMNILVPRLKSAVVVLSNAEHADPSPLARELVGLLLKDAERREETVPTIAGPPTKEAAIAMFRQLQSGAVDRKLLGEEYNVWLTDQRIRDAAVRLKELGEPTSVELGRARERGGMEASRVQFKFKSGTVEANMFRSPDGKIQQFLLMRQ